LKIKIEELIGLTNKVGGKVASTPDGHKFEFNAEQMICFKKLIRERRPIMVTLPNAIEKMLDSKSQIKVSK